MTGQCSGVAASWCPRCGDCTCPKHEDGEPIERTVEPANIGRPWPIVARVASDDCPLHGTESQHACEAGCAAVDDPPPAATLALELGDLVRIEGRGKQLRVVGFELPNREAVCLEPVDGGERFTVYAWRLTR